MGGQKVSSVILEASSILALINKEPGSEVVREVLSEAVMPSVNVAEIVGILMARHQISSQDVRVMMN